MTSWLDGRNIWSSPQSDVIVAAVGRRFPFIVIVNLWCVDLLRVGLDKFFSECARFFDQLEDQQTNPSCICDSVRDRTPANGGQQLNTHHHDGTSLVSWTGQESGFLCTWFLSSVPSNDV